MAESNNLIEAAKKLVDGYDHGRTYGEAGIEDLRAAVNDPFLSLPIADPIPRGNVVDALVLHLSQIDFEKDNWDWDHMARAAYLFLMQPGMPCGHARAFFFQNEQGLTGCVACDMWEDAFAK